MSRSLRALTYEIIFEADTPAGKAFDVGLLAAIFLSVVAVCLESVAAFAAAHGATLRALEWVFTVVFAFEYLLRLWCAPRARHYALSFFGVVDLVSVLPSFASLVIPGAQSLLVIRASRLLRVFRILKLGRYLSESQALVEALYASRRKISVFLFAVMTVAVWIGALMYLVEGPQSGFSSIPRGVYWAIVTLTTVGYGDIAPKTALGQGLASLLMVVGYGVIAVPTGIVTTEMARLEHEHDEPPVPHEACRHCGRSDHARDAKFCKHCGGPLPH